MKTELCEINFFNNNNAENIFDDYDIIYDINDIICNIKFQKKIIAAEGK